MKILKRIMYTLLGLVLTGAVVMVIVILYAEYSGRRFSTKTAPALAQSYLSDEESRLVYDENGNIAELPSGAYVSALNGSADGASSLSDAAKTLGTTLSSEYSAQEASDEAASSAVGGAELPYVMDLGSAIFHTEDCPYAANIASGNRSSMTTSREKIINAGYTPCANCNP